MTHSEARSTSPCVGYTCQRSAPRNSTFDCRASFVIRHSRLGLITSGATDTAVSLPNFSDRDILDARASKNPVDSSRPYAFLVEPECSAAGRVEDVATLFLTNRECPFRCLMCDLWRNTTDGRVPVGAIPQQIDYALRAIAARRATSSSTTAVISSTTRRSRRRIMRRSPSG